MKKLLLTLMLALLSTNAMALWTRVGGEDETALYADFATLRKEGDKVKMWHLGDFQTLQGNTGRKFLSFKVQSEYDCKEEQIRVLAVSMFSGNMGRGNVGFTYNGDPTNWEPIEPQSFGKTLWVIACNEGT